jgi:cell division protein FtsI/penicillin-binding protein 2
MVPEVAATSSATPSATPQEDAAKKKLEEIEKLKQDMLDRLNKNLYWVNLGRRVDTEMMKKLKALDLVGLGFQQNTQRFYPEGSSSAQISGFVGSDIFGEDTGYFGLEGYYNGELKGKRGLIAHEQDALGLPILIGKYISQDPKPGKTLVLNVDRTVQRIVENSLKTGMEKYGAKNASAIIMDPQTGAILAMASYPSYDQSRPGLYPKESYRDLGTADAYEPGSTFKVLVMAAAVNEGLVKPDTQCDICAGPVKISGYDIKTWDNKYTANIDMTHVIINSDNTGMVFIARKLGIDKMYDYIKSFGFGDITGIDLQDEQSPALREKKDWKEIDLATSSFGQGLSATPLQVVRGVAAIANGGKILEPHIVSKIIDGDTVTNIQPRIISQPITEETAKTMTDMMVRAVNEGESKFSKVKGFKIAGKTGTAQIPVAGHYDATKTIASFVGFAPADNPKFVMLVRFSEPTTSIYGAETAAPTFFDITRQLLYYYRIKPTEPN